MVREFICSSILIALCVLAKSQYGVNSQGVGTLEPEVHPPLTWRKCSAGGQCVTKEGEVVIDANWRWVHNSAGTNCYKGNTWNAHDCPDDKTCAANCYLEGAKYEETYGITTDGGSIKMDFITQSQGKNIGSRTYLMADESTYQLFHLLDQEFTFDVDSSHLPCGINGALYLVSMDEDGGSSKYPTNKAGAKYGTGYCDAQCPRDLKFIAGQANVEGWIPSKNNVNTGVGNHGSCCPEMDLWEANIVSQAFTSHPCSSTEMVMCDAKKCGGTGSTSRYAGTCDPDGCDINPYRMGNKTFYGPGMTLDSRKPMTVVTQFWSHGSGKLKEIKRFYVQGGKIISQPQSLIDGVTGNSITEQFCTDQKNVFGDQPSFSAHGGLAKMGEALSKGMVLVMSLWDDYDASMLWLDSSYPTTKSTLNKPGVARGSCPTSSGVPKDVEAQHPDAYVVYSNIRTGPIGSTLPKIRSKRTNPVRPAAKGSSWKSDDK
eukprot:gene11953-13929_t